MNQMPVILPKRSFLNPKSVNNPSNMNRNKASNEQNKQGFQSIEVKSLKIKIECTDDRPVSIKAINKNQKTCESNKAQRYDSAIINLKKMISQRQAYNSLNGPNVKNLKQKHHVVNVKDSYDPTGKNDYHGNKHVFKNHQVASKPKVYSKLDDCYVCKYATKREIIRLPEIISRNNIRSQNTKTHTTTCKANEDQMNKGSSIWSINMEENQFNYQKSTNNQNNGSRNNSLITAMNFLNQYESRLSYYRRNQNNLVRNQLET
jgi:hypothetical protein